MAIEFGISRAHVDRMSELVVDIKLEELNLSTKGSVEEKRRRLWEACQPIYPLPRIIGRNPRSLIFSSLLDEQGNPRPEGVERQTLLDQLYELGYPDDVTAEQTIRIQLDNLVKFYGYTVVRDNDIIIVERREPVEQ